MAELDLNPETLVPESTVGEDDAGGCASGACAADCVPSWAKCGRPRGLSFYFHLLGDHWYMWKD